MITCAFLSVVGLSSTGLKSVCGARPQASACKAWSRPISPPSTVTAELSAMFCGLNGATWTPRRFRMRHSAATKVDLPASDVVPWTIRAEQGMDRRKREKRRLSRITGHFERRVAMNRKNLVYVRDDRARRVMHRIEA